MTELRAHRSARTESGSAKSPNYGLSACAIFIAFVVAGPVAGRSLSAQYPRIDAAARACAPVGRITREHFQSVMQTVAEGWNRGDAKLAASCFSENAVYSGPPSPGHLGRKALYKFFGGAKGRKLPMHMVWHTLLFDPEKQIGSGEYTFRYRKQTHGLVIVKISNGLIVNWREYEVESELPWDQFVGDNRF
jgi:hypothetical protein